jgi:hypothetical protein
LEVSKVEKQQAQRAEAERMTKKLDKEARQKKSDSADKQKFGSMLKNQGAEARQKANDQQKGMQRQQGEQVGEQQSKLQQNQARTARMARGGVVQHNRLMQQAKSFDGALAKAKTESGETKKENVESRKEGAETSKAATTERTSDLETKAETRKDADAAQAKAEAKAEGRVNAAIGGAGGKGGRGSGGEAGADGSGVQGAGGAKEAGGAEQVQGAAGAKGIPEEIIEALAEEIYVGFNAQGLAEMQIELKEGVLDGGLMKITADDRGGVKIAFERLDKNTANLVKASEGELFRRLKGKGINLSELTV